jgi:hypothetical protein
MGMIAFYAGLFVGILLGVLFSSLWAFSLARRTDGARPDRAEALSPAGLPELAARQSSSPGPDAVQVGARG